MARIPKVPGLGRTRKPKAISVKVPLATYQVRAEEPTATPEAQPHDEPDGSEEGVNG